MPANVLHPSGVLRIYSDNRIFVLYTSIEHFNFPIRKASNESLRGSMVRYKGSDWTVRVGVQILLPMISISQSTCLLDVPDPEFLSVHPTL